MKQNSEKEIAEEIKRLCRLDLDKLVKRTKIPRERWVGMAVQAAADRTGDDQWEKHKKWLRDRAKWTNYFEENIDNLCTAADARGFAGVVENLKPVAESLRKSRDEIVKILGKNKRNHRHTLIVLLNSMLDERFDCWAALTRVIKKAYRAAGREDADKITAEMLRKRVMRTSHAFRASFRASMAVNVARISAENARIEAAKRTLKTGEQLQYQQQ